ncbi:MAG: hypothetical protein ABIV39_01110, partial [Verrucomicrobiota bacterium]
MRLKFTTSSLCLVIFLGLAPSSRGANLIMTNVQGSAAATWAANWKTNGTGTAVAPVAGNTYVMAFNGTSIGNGAANTRLRNLTAPPPAIQTFPGDTLTVGTNTEFRFKTPNAIVMFPGVGGNAGLLLDGGMLNSGDDGTFVIGG